jgi:F0F1-type ATP synthase assembly protein I
VRKTAKTDWGRGAVYTDLGLRFALAAALGGYLGYLLDQELHLFPLFLIVGIMLGGTAGFISLYRTVMRLTESERRSRDSGRDSKGPNNKIAA